MVWNERTILVGEESREASNKLYKERKRNVQDVVKGNDPEWNSRNEN